MYKAILFDLDGTLLPMDYDEFTKMYFKELCKVLAPYGIEPKTAVDAVWYGTKGMIMNNGEQSNKDVFWKGFAEMVGGDTGSYIAATDPFYDGDFH